ncbi:MAG: hypothetical protein IPG96_06870 [Proteobacteria bacterium]|nr:hypothetical protein [Pseudomonadota bacterium]
MMHPLSSEQVGGAALGRKPEVASRRRAAVLGALVWALSGCGATRAPAPSRQLPAPAATTLSPDARATVLVAADALAVAALTDAAAAASLRRMLTDALGPADADFAWAWRLARAEFLCSRRAGDRAGQAAAAERGVVWARQALRRDAQRVEGHYYLALCLGQLAEARSKLGLVKPMEAAAKQAAALDPRYDGAGPLVFLGKLYLTAPGWPLSLGDVERAVATLQRALALDPRPLTRLFLAQALAEDDQREAAAGELQQVLAASPALEPRWRAEAERLRQKLGLAVRDPAP